MDLLGGAKGGLRDGDSYSTEKVIGEYDLVAGDVLTVVPTIWEWDPGSSYQSQFDATIQGVTPHMSQSASQTANQRFPSSNVALNTAAIIGLLTLDLGTYVTLNIAKDALNNLVPKPRPIGVKKDGIFNPKGVIFTGNAMTQIAKGNFGYGLGVIPVQYNEEAPGNDRDHGNYNTFREVHGSHHDRRPIRMGIHQNMRVMSVTGHLDLHVHHDM